MAMKVEMPGERYLLGVAIVALMLYVMDDLYKWCAFYSIYFTMAVFHTSVSRVSFWWNPLCMVTWQDTLGRNGRKMDTRMHGRATWDRSKMRWTNSLLFISQLSNRYEYAVMWSHQIWICRWYNKSSSKTGIYPLAPNLRSQQVDFMSVVLLADSLASHILHRGRSGHTATIELLPW